MLAFWKPILFTRAIRLPSVRWKKYREYRKMPQIWLLRPLLIGAILGGVFLFVLHGQISDPANRQQAGSERLTLTQVADVIGVISDICDKIDLGVSSQRSQLTEGRLANANILVSEVCTQVGPHLEQVPVQPAGASLGETERPADFAVYDGV
jgi:hypothetical protein